jgi:hypothetical protein
VGRARCLLVALFVVLAAPASALAGPCIDVTTGAAGSVTPTSATIAGTLDPHGQTMSYRFDLGPTIAYTSSTPTRNPAATSATNVTEKLLGLTPGTTYHFRLVGTTPCGTEYGLDVVFATPLTPGQQPYALQPLVYTGYGTGNADVYIATSDGGNPRDLTNSAGSDFDGQLSPDFSRVVFTSMRSGHGDLYVVNVDGSNLVRITTSREADLEPAWSPDGKQLVFVSRGPAGPGLFLVNADGTGRRRLTTDRNGAADPSWSPNGQTIAFTRSVRGTAAEVYTVPAAGGTPVRLTHNTVPDIQPQWSPDGTKLVWTRTSATGASSLIVALANDTGETTVTAATELARFPVWLRDGARIAYIGLAGGRPALTVLIVGGPALRLFPVTP